MMIKSPKLHILVVAPTPFFSDRGTHIRILEEALALEQLGHTVTIATYHIGKNIPSFLGSRIDARTTKEGQGGIGRPQGKRVEEHILEGDLSRGGFGRRLVVEVGTASREPARRRADLACPTLAEVRDQTLGNDRSHPPTEELAASIKEVGRPLGNVIPPNPIEPLPVELLVPGHRMNEVHPLGHEITHHVHDVVDNPDLLVGLHARPDDLPGISGNSCVRAKVVVILPIKPLADMHVGRGIAKGIPGLRPSQRIHPHRPLPLPPEDHRPHRRRTHPGQGTSLALLVSLRPGEVQWLLIGHARPGPPRLDWNQTMIQPPSYTGGGAVRPGSYPLRTAP